MELKLDDKVIATVPDGLGKLILESLDGKKNLEASGDVHRYFPWSGSRGSLDVNIKICATLPGIAKDDGNA